MTSRRMLARAGVCAVVFAISAPALAQQAGIQVAVVRADDGAPLADSAIVIENHSLAIRRTVRTDARGQVRIEGLTTAGAYTLAKLTNDTDDINFRASNANDFAADRGPSANDRRHVISAVGYLYPFEGFTFTAAGLFQSGQPVNFVPDARIFGTQDLNGDGQSFGENFVGNSDRFPGAGRNAGRLPWSASVDVGVRYALPIGFGRVELSADVFNAFNANNESGFANAATTSNQVQFGGGAPFIQRNAGPPRQFQFGAAFKF